MLVAKYLYVLSERA